MVKINAGIDEKQPIKNPVINTDCCKQSEINEASFNQVLHGASTTSKTFNQYKVNNYMLNTTSCLNICKSIALKKDKKMLSVFMEMV